MMEEVESMKQRAKLSFQNKNYEEAASLYSEAIVWLQKRRDEASSSTMEDVLPLLYTNRAICYKKVKQWNECITDCTEALEYSNCLKAKTLFTRAAAYEMLMDMEAAYADLLECHKHDTTNKEVTTALQRIQKHVENEKKDKNLMAPLLTEIFDEVLPFNTRVNSINKLGCLLQNQKRLICNKHFIEKIKQMNEVKENIGFRCAFLRLLHSFIIEVDDTQDLDIPSNDKQIDATNMEAGTSHTMLEVTQIVYNITPPSLLIRECSETLRLPIRESAGGRDAADDDDEGVQRKKIVLHILAILKYAAMFEDEFIQLIDSAINCVESPSIQHAALLCSGRALQRLKNMGRKVEPLKLTHWMTKLLESLLSVLTDNTLEDLASFCLARIFELLADLDRNEKDTVDTSQMADSLFTRFFTTTFESNELIITGFKGLKALYQGSPNIFKSYMISSNLMSLILDKSTQEDAEAAEMQPLAAELLVGCMSFLELRQDLIQNNGIELLVDLCEVLKEPTGLQIAAVLSRLCTHNEEIRQTVFKKMSLFKLLQRIFQDLDVQNMRKDSLESLLEVVCYLSLHGAFKKKLTESSYSSMFAKFIEIGDKALTHSVKSSFMYCTILLFLFSSQKDADEHSNRRTTNKSADFDEGQMEELRELYKRLPAAACPKANSEYDLGSGELSGVMRSHFLKAGVVKQLHDIIKQSKGLSAAFLGNVSSCLRLLCCNQHDRGFIMQQGGLSALLTCADGLKANSEDLRDARQALAQLCISIQPSLFSYSEAHQLIPHLLELLNDHHELFQFEGAMALTNLASFNEELRDKIWDQNGWKLFGNLMFSDNSQVRAAGLEGWCNLSCSDKACTHIYELMKRGCEHQDIAVLLAFCVEFVNVRAQVAATGALAMLCYDSRLAALLPSHPKFEYVWTAWQKSDDENVLLRLVTLFNAIAQEEDVSVSIKERILKELNQRSTEVPQNLMEKITTLQTTLNQQLEKHM